MGLSPYFRKDTLEAGCDEVGRGCLAGPVVAAAVILPPDYSHDILNDSKKLTPKQRHTLAQEIKQDAISWGIGEASTQEIDQINILNASFLAMHRALDQLAQPPEHLLIDGHQFNGYQNLPYETIVQGDGKYYAIAAASVLAKTHRDAWMKTLHNTYPHYGWTTNVGYPTKIHRAGIQKHGTSPHHRRSFRLLPKEE